MAGRPDRGGHLCLLPTAASLKLVVKEALGLRLRPSCPHPLFSGGDLSRGFRLCVGMKRLAITISSLWARCFLCYPMSSLHSFEEDWYLHFQNNILRSLKVLVTYPRSHEYQVAEMGLRSVWLRISPASYSTTLHSLPKVSWMGWGGSSSSISLM